VRLPHGLFRRVAGANPLGLLLGATLVLAAWLGYQALDAATSQRRTAEAVLRDYALISATELSRVARANLDDVLDEVFGPISPRRRERGLPRPEVLVEGMVEAMREERCPCPAFRSPLAVFRAEAGETLVAPDTLPERVGVRLAELVASRRPPDERTGLLTTAAGELLDVPVVVGYSVLERSGGVAEVTYGFVVSTTALGEILREWYDERALLPRAIAGEQPNDSLLYVTVRDPAGEVVFASSIEYPSSLGATAPLGEEFAALEVMAAIRPDAASQLVIGGLPGSRLPLLSLLLLLTLGVGVAAFVQLRREQTFQRLRDDFVSGVSHELRTPLAQIRMFAELQQDGKLLSEEDRTRAVLVIHREARRLTHLVENILQFSRLRRTAGQRMPKEALDMVEALREGVDAVAPLLEDRGMKLELAGQPGLAVVANREALTRIVVNLLDNAVKYGPAGQTVKVGVERVNGSVRLSVADQGPGVPPAERQAVWKPYRRLERDVKAHVPGTGIGLSVVSELAHLHDGRAWVEGGEGGGARFVVELPLLGVETGEGGEGRGGEGER
jgi:signal transduction histidine kinase